MDLILCTFQQLHFLHFKTRIDELLKKKKKNLIYVNIYTIMKSVSQVLIKIDFLF